MTCGFSLPQIQQLLLFTLPEMWKVAFSEKTACFRNALSLSNLNNISCMNVCWLGLRGEEPWKLSASFSEVPVFLSVLV
jgi:hypothetical protein